MTSLYGDWRRGPADSKSRVPSSCFTARRCGLTPSCTRALRACRAGSPQLLPEPLAWGSAAGRGRDLHHFTATLHLAVAAHPFGSTPPTPAPFQTQSAASTSRRRRHTSRPCCCRSIPAPAASWGSCKAEWMKRFSSPCPRRSWSAGGREAAARLPRVAMGPAGTPEALARAAQCPGRQRQRLG